MTSNLIQINKYNKPITTSFSVAEVFEKNHKDVLRCVKLLKCSKDFNERNFTPVTYKDKKGEKRTYYEMTRDGWTFLVMSFTGTKAAAFKEKYIDAFNAMETKLKEFTGKPVFVAEHTRRLPSTPREIVLSEKAKEEVGGIVKRCAAVALRDEFEARDQIRAENADLKNRLKQIQLWASGVKI